MDEEKYSAQYVSYQWSIQSVNNSSTLLKTVISLKITKITSFKLHIRIVEPIKMKDSVIS